VQRRRERACDGIAMKIGMITDSLGALSFDDLLGTAAELGIEKLEFAAGNWSLAPFIRYERFNTAAQYADIGPKLTPAVLPDSKVWTTGLNWTIAPGVVIKGDYLNFQSTGRSNRFDLGMGYQF